MTGEITADQLQNTEPSSKIIKSNLDEILEKSPETSDIFQLDESPQISAERTLIPEIVNSPLPVISKDEYSNPNMALSSIDPAQYGLLATSLEKFGLNISADQLEMLIKLYPQVKSIRGVILIGQLFYQNVQVVTSDGDDEMIETTSNVIFSHKTLKKRKTRR